MRLFALLDKFNIVQRTQEFEEAPVLAPEKGLHWVKWIEATPPAITKLQKLSVPVVVELADGEHNYQWQVQNLSTDARNQIIAVLKKNKNDQINQRRAIDNSATFIFQDKVIAVDAVSRSDIEAVAGYVSLFGVFPDGWIGKWKAVDNTFVSMTEVDEFKAMYKAMTDTGLKNFKDAQIRKALLASATTPEDIESVVSLPEPKNPVT